MRNMRILLAGLVALSPPLAATPISYDELISGDLAKVLPYDETTNVGTLGLGANTVTGGLTEPLFDDTSDEFAFYIAEHTRLLNLFFEFSGVVPYTSLTVFIRKISDPTTSSIVFEDSTRIVIGVDQPSSRVFQSALPFGAGLYQISTPASFGFPDTDFLNLDYTWRLIVTPAPELGALALLGIGLAGHVLATHRNLA